MNNVTKIVTLLRQQAELEFRILAERPDAVEAEREWESTRRRLIAHPAKPSARYWRPPARSNERLTPSRYGMLLRLVGPTNSAKIHARGVPTFLT